MASYLEEELLELMGALKGQYLETLADKPDSELVLSATTMLDQFIGMAMIVRFPMQLSKIKYENVFEYPGPLGTFSSKCELAEALGILVGEMPHDLKHLRKLRNEFAHTIQIPSLTDPELSRRCKNLRLRYDLKPETIVRVGNEERRRVLESIAMCIMYLTITLTRSIVAAELSREHAEELDKRARAHFESNTGVKLTPPAVPAAEAATS